MSFLLEEGEETDFVLPDAYKHLNYLYQLLLGLLVALLILSTISNLGCSMQFPLFCTSLQPDALLNPKRVNSSAVVL